jgi:serine/threonine protein kinase
MEKAKHSFEDLKREFEENDESFSKFYIIDSIIGEGAFGIVLSCLEIKTNTSCAVKVLNLPFFLLINCHYSFIIFPDHHQKVFQHKRSK